MRTTESDDWSRTGSLSGSSAMLKRQHDGYTWVFITNTSSWSGSRFPRKIAAMMKQAMGKIKKWPDRFRPVVPTVAGKKITGSAGCRSFETSRKHLFGTFYSYFFGISSPRNTRSAFSASAPISSSPGITSTGAIKETRSRIASQTVPLYAMPPVIRIASDRRVRQP